MNKKIFFIFLFLISNTIAGELPDWVRKPDCGNDICAVGHGNSLELAIVDARNNIQKIFETKISSKFKNEVKQDKEESSETLYEESEGILKGTSIKETYNKNNDFYVLAVLDRVKVANDIEFDIKMLDKKMAVLIDDNSVTSSKKIEEMYKKRESLNKRYLFLTGKEMKEEIEYKDVFENNKNNFSKVGSYYINIKNEELKSFLTNLFNENGIKIATNSSSAKKVIDGRLISKKEFLNVEGFEKYSFTLSLQLISNGKVVKSINKKITDTGVNYDQIYNKVMNQFYTYLEKNVIKIME